MTCLLQVLWGIVLESTVCIKNCPLMVHDREFSVDLIALPFHEFDLILGMDWLSKHRAIVDCDKKIVLLKCPDLSEVRIQGIRSE